MNDLSERLGIFAAQGLVLFFGMSILLGRIYFQTYFDTLGIPSSAVSMNIVDYSIIEPSITIMGITMAVLAPLVYLLQLVLPSKQTYSKPQIWIGTLMMSGPVVATFLFPLVETGFFVPIGSVLLLPIGGSLVVHNVSVRRAAILAARHETSDEFTRTGVHKVMAAVVLVMIFVFAFVIAKNFSEMAARAEATLAKEESPSASIELTPKAQGLFHKVHECVTQESDECTFRVILIGKEFIYLHPVSSMRSGVYAIPLEDVERIYYLPVIGDT